MAAVASSVMTASSDGLTGPEFRINRTATRPPFRLTQRGRIVVTGVSALLAGLLSVGLAAAAQATRHTGTGGPGRYLTRVVVQPGQNLWSLAETHAPDADPRQTIAQVLQRNSLASDQLFPGQVLWMPRG